MAAPLLSANGLTFHLGDKPLFDGLDLMVQPGDRLCLVGRNGAGKSTLLKMLAGLIEPDGGDIRRRSDARLVYLPQAPEPGDAARVLDYVAGGLSPAERDATHLAEEWLDTLGLAHDADPQTLSGGELRKASLARALVGRPDLLLLDEPTNHLDLSVIAWLEGQLARFAGAFVVISHDRAFLERVSRGTLWLDRGRIRRLDRGFGAFADWSQKVLEDEAEANDKLDKRIAEETRWSREGITARRKRNQGRLRRLDALRADRANRPAPTGKAVAQTTEAAKSGKLVVEARNIAKRYGERTIVADFSTRIHRGDRVGIIGPNGAGKTTLVKMLTGALAPDAGTVRLGTNLDLLSIDQRRSTLDLEASVWDTVTGGRGDMVGECAKAKHAVSYLKDFLFTAAQAKSPVKVLSGGEQNRLLLARELLKPCNLMVLDEPTNDLDMETLELLEELLSDFDGTIILISHDRALLDHVVTSTIMVDGRGGAVEYAGGFSDAEAQGAVAGWLDGSGGAARRARKKPAAKAGAKAGAGDAPQAAGRAAKLSYQEQRTLDALPGEIEKLEGLIAKLEALLADPSLYERDPARFDKATRELARLQAKLADKEDQWLTLEARREGG
ncbi:elongation factor 3 [Rhodothalassium salexigens]|uniref:ABC-F family ATP-binding cassette domain-containing protein n=1 Tax=Rhodothalassium salexigens TaxID=1086 RepID=UPI0019123E53|nr:ATP-binding cassette domain-containing protein [Rhodothalassium salexigens]MBK5921001.1 elongation factor 3 [Rhodothalassium salexigens]